MYVLHVGVVADEKLHKFGLDLLGFAAEDEIEFADVVLVLFEVAVGDSALHLPLHHVPHLLPRCGHVLGHRLFACFHPISQFNDIFISPWLSDLIAL